MPVQMGSCERRLLLCSSAQDQSCIRLCTKQPAGAGRAWASITLAKVKLCSLLAISFTTSPVRMLAAMFCGTQTNQEIQNQVCSSAETGMRNSFHKGAPAAAPGQLGATGRGRAFEVSSVTKHGAPALMSFSHFGPA